MKISPMMNAITFVALGTSLPDTFASKAAAVSDPYADASIGNITGSNSVNVFLGLGVPWLVAAIYWEIAGPTADWYAKQVEQGPATGWVLFDGEGGAMKADYSGGGFIVVSGGLVKSVAIFSVCAVTCISSLVLRRKVVGGELGGSTQGKWATSG